ncbi:MAG: A/G-specific adenine glycosylase [Flammeovirgaceae bacterium]|nr:A/G-specific adenine glycosylase [Flammeovirgaceae bacterium]
MNKKSFFTQQVLIWYSDHQRNLPWRSTRDPYTIWLSEIILQQTRVAQGLPYFMRFIKKFPSVYDLAKASEKKVLKEWEGLGYYTRARNLHRCAKRVVSKYNGRFPDTYNELITLPGIGSYTAAAIASISFNECVPVVDGNVNRVLCRVFGIHDEIQSSTGKKRIYALAEKLIDCRQPAAFNQAIMEFGALHCTPKAPRCSDCTLAKICVANKEQLQEWLPVKKKKAPVRKRFFTYFMIKDGRRWAMQQRKGNDIWKGLYEPYLIETKQQKTVSELIKKDTFLKVLNPDPNVKPSPVYHHLLSHQKLTIRFVELAIKRKPGKDFKMPGIIKFYSKSALESLPKAIIVHRFIKEHVAT